MTLLYQPISRTFGQRDGCLTPNNTDEMKPKTTLKFNVDNHEILSPPLSPYQRIERPDKVDNHYDSSYTTHTPLAQKCYLESSHPFKLENFKSYKLTVSPWSNLNSDYKRRQLRFLDQYKTVSKEQSNTTSLRMAERRAAQAANAQKRRRERHHVSSDSETDRPEKVRTRRVVRDHLAPLSEIDMDSTRPSSTAPASPSPKKRKTVKKEPSYVGSPLAAQQAALIDESIPDYSPNPYETLPQGNPRCLKIEWKGQPMDLKNDPDASKLHPAEIVLASTLRLPANVYLDSKRRFFFEKVNRLRDGMPFRRTDAQKACRIDVNKASRLFAAFEKVGWLDDSNFAKYL